ncbi:MAG TPA: DUF3592 domain-containing protein, partial [Candidatus Limnocylindrales bacterium]|nr:DUF3592 domain-containing protein [Candidatus Limnocylindrales bacterium]
MFGSTAPSAGAVGRRRRTRAGDAKIPIWFGPVFGLFGVVFLVIGLGLVRDELRLSSDGVRTDGTIVAASINHGTGDDADTYSIAYEFPLTDGTTVRGSSQVDPATYERAVPGAPVEISYLPGDPATNRLGKPEFQPFPSLLVVGVASLFTVVGIGLTWTAVRQRRAANAEAAAAAAALARGEVHDPEQARVAASLPAPDAFGNYRFTRSPMRIVVDLLGAPIGAIAFLGAAVFMFGQAGSDLTFAIGGLVFGFFGLLMAASAFVTVRRGVRSTVLEVGPSGIWLPEMGRLAWDAIREVRVEDTLGAGGTARRAQGYARLGIHPRDPALAARAPGGLARGMTGAFFGFIRLARPSVRTPDIAALAPFGIAAYELEQPLDAAVTLVGRWVPVLDPEGTPVAGSMPAAGAAVSASVPDTSPGAPTADPDAVADPSTALAGLLAGSGTPFMATTGPISAATTPAATTASSPAAPDSPTDAGRSREALVRSLFAPSAATSPASGPAAPSLAAPVGGSGSGRAAYRRRGIAALGAFADLARALVFLALPLIVVVVFVGVGAGDGVGGFVFFGLFPIALASIFVLAGVPALLEALGRLQLGTDDDDDALVVDDTGIEMTGMGRLGWDEIAEIRVGDADVVEGSDHSHPDR